MTAKIEKPEFCAGVKILIERMNTNPEDFGKNEYDPSMMRTIKRKRFSEVAQMLDGLLFGSKEVKADVAQHWKEWGYLSKEEQDALMSAYKQMRRTEFDKQIMERVFDDKFYERQAEEEEQRRLDEAFKAQLYQRNSQAAQQQITQTSGTAYYGPSVNSLLGTGGIF
jgi:hypothetical protein